MSMDAKNLGRAPTIILPTLLLYDYITKDTEIMISSTIK